MPAILVLNGPNLQHLGQREPELYGSEQLIDIQNNLVQKANQHDIELVCYQSDSESELLAHLNTFHQNGFDTLILNPAALTHSSIILRDALLAHCIPFIEVHLTNPHKRETFRRVSLFSDIAKATISGCGALGYELAFEAARHQLGINHG